MTGIQYNPEGIAEEEAIERVRSGKSIITLNQYLAKNLVYKVSELNRADHTSKEKTTKKWQIKI